MSNSSTTLKQLGQSSIKELETDRGILASSKTELYACIFGRDSLISALKLMRGYEKEQDAEYLALVRKILINLAALQGKNINIESGEEPGKIIHEYRPDNHERLTGRAKRAWYVYPEGDMRNYDSVDSTPLFLIATARYIELAPTDAGFVADITPHVQNALTWLSEHGDSNADGFIDYQMNPARTHGGLKVQNWMDSKESLFHEDGTAVVFPIAPVEVQAYAYAALRHWAHIFQKTDAVYSATLNERADELKENFNTHFIKSVGDTFFLASAIDGTGKAIEAVRSSMGHVLWACVTEHNIVPPDGILNQEYVPALVHRLMQPDMFEPMAGIRTLSTASRHYNPLGYHNGSIWPHDSGMIAEGMERFGFKDEAQKILTAIAGAIQVFGTPIELVTVVDGALVEGMAESTQHACKVQAWTAATLLAEME